MSRTQSKAAKLSGRLALAATLLVFTQASALARQQQPTPARPPQTPEQRTGRSYDTAAPARKPPTPAPQSQSPVNFTETTAQSGVKFRQYASHTSQKYLPETMGGGV